MKRLMIAGALVMVQAAAPGGAAKADGPIIVSEDRAEGEMMSAAIGHYARARSFVILALKKFDRGVRQVDPQAVLDIDQWRNTLLDRAEDLERILDPQPQADAQGVDFTPAARHVNRVYLEPKPLKSKGTPIVEAKGENLMIAVGHYTQARDLLFAAVREFDAGLAIANPQVLVDVNEWRVSALERAEDLDRVVAPKPRQSEKGVAYRPDSRLLNEAFK